MSSFKRTIVENRFKKNTIQRTLTFRSNWEVLFANFLDFNTNVKEWVSDYPIKYRDRFGTQRVKTYYIDFKVGMTDGSILLVEVKPIKSLQMRIKTESVRYKRIHTTNYLKNLSKFETVELFCRKMNWEFFLVEKSSDRGFKFYRWDMEKKYPVLV